MKKLFFNFNRLLLLGLAVMTMSSVFGATTYTFTDKSWADATNSWTSGKAGNGFTNGQGIQVTTGATGANATTKSSVSGITKIEVKYCTNASAGVGAIKVQVGTNAEQSFSVTKPAKGTGTTLKTATFNFSPAQSGTVKVTCNCTTNSVYINSVTITAASGYDITYECNGATSGCPEKATGQTALPDPLPAAPVKTGYTFDGWFTNSGLTDAAEAGASISANTTLYAKWMTPVYLNLGSVDWAKDNACFNVWDGVANNSLTKVTECGQTNVYSGLVVASAINSTLYFKRNSSDCGTKWNEASGTLTATNNMMTLTDWNAGTMGAYAPPTFTVSCAPNTSGYGTVSQASVTNVACGTSISASGATLTVGTTNVTATAASQTAQYTYGFTNWTWTESLSSVTKDITATANFTRTTRSYTINALSLTGCTVTGTAWPTGKKDYGSSFSTTISASEGYQLPSSISVTGADYTWNQSTGALAITSVKGDVSVTITATKKTYTVTFYNVGELKKTVSNVEHGTLFSAIKPTVGTGSGQLDIKSCDATSTTFMGWTSDASFQKRSNAPSFITDDTAITGDLELRAVWARAE